MGNGFSPFGFDLRNGDSFSDNEVISSTSNISFHVFNQLDLSIKSVSVSVLCNCEMLLLLGMPADNAAGSTPGFRAVWWSVHQHEVKLRG